MPKWHRTVILLFFLALLTLCKTKHGFGNTVDLLYYLLFKHHEGLHCKKIKTLYWKLIPVCGDLFFDFLFVVTKGHTPEPKNSGTVFMFIRHFITNLPVINLNTAHKSRHKDNILMLCEFM